MRKLCWAGVMLLLSACGWQLQGARPVDAALLPLYLDLPDEHSDFAVALVQQLRQSGVSYVSDPTVAQAVLVVSKDESGHHVVSVSALNEPQQYEVFYDLSYRIERRGKAQASTLLSPQIVNLTRTMSYDKNLALAKEREESALRRQLAQEQASQLLRRLTLLNPAKLGEGSP